MHTKPTGAGMGAYLSRIHDVQSARREIATPISEMITAPVNANPQWFLHGSGA
jgi:hypothetical protein